MIKSKREKLGLEPNVYQTNQGTFKYIRPDKKRGEPGRERGLGSNKQIANKNARYLNAQLIAKSDLAESILNHDNVTMNQHLDNMLIYWQDKVKRNKLAPRTLLDYTNDTKRIRLALGKRYMYEDDIAVIDITKFLKQFPPRTGQKFRSTLRLIFKHAIGQGYRKTNPAADSMPIECDKTRRRLSYEDFLTIRKYAPPWFQHTMDLALHTLQRREDLVVIKPKDHIKEENGKKYLYIIQQKTSKHGESAFLRIDCSIALMGVTLEQVIEQCKDKDVASPYLLHWPTSARRKKIGKPFTPENLTRAFQKARNEAMKAEGLFADLSPEELPTLHEVRSTGGDLFIKEAGWSKGQVQKLFGHTNAKQTQDYLKGHAIEWTDIQVDAQN